MREMNEIDAVGKVVGVAAELLQWQDCNSDKKCVDRFRFCFLAHISRWLVGTEGRFLAASLDVATSTLLRNDVVQKKSILST